MKAIAISFFLWVAYSLQLSAQKIVGVKNKNIVSSGTHFTQPVKDKNWGNQNRDSYTKATYSE